MLHCLSLPSRISTGYAELGQPSDLDVSTIMNSAYGSSDVPRQVPIGGHGSMPSIPPVASSSSASNSAALDHLYHHQPELRHPHNAIPQSPISSQAPPHLHPQPHHFQLLQGQNHHQPPIQEREQHLPTHPATYNTHPQESSHSQNFQHNALSQRLDPSHSAGEQKDQPQHLLDPRPHESFTSPTSSTLSHSESQQVGSANMLIPFSKVDEITGRKYQLVCLDALLLPSQMANIVCKS